MGCFLAASFFTELVVVVSLQYVLFLVVPFISVQYELLLVVSFVAVQLVVPFVAVQYELFLGVSFVLLCTMTKHSCCFIAFS